MVAGVLYKHFSSGMARDKEEVVSEKYTSSPPMPEEILGLYRPIPDRLWKRRRNIQIRELPSRCHMKIIRTYREFEIEFVFPDELAKHLALQGIEPSSVVSSDHEWFELFLFYTIDKDQDGRPDENFGHRFQIFFYDMILDDQEGAPKELPICESPNDTNRILCDGARKIGPMRLRYRLLMKTDS